MQLDSSWLVRQTSYEEAVRDNLVDGRVFGEAHDDWQRLESKMQAGDEFWYFEPPSPDVIHVWGLALVRQGVVISTVITAVD